MTAQANAISNMNLFRNGLSYEAVSQTLTQEQNSVQVQRQKLLEQLAALELQEATLNQKHEQLREEMSAIADRPSMQQQSQHTNRKPLPPCIIQMIVSHISFDGMIFWFLNKKIASHSSVRKTLQLPMYYIPIDKSFFKPAVLRFLADRDVLPNDHHETIEYYKHDCQYHGQDFDRHIGYINYYDLIQPVCIMHTLDIDADTHETTTYEKEVDIMCDRIRSISASYCDNGPSDDKCKRIIAGVKKTLSQIVAAQEIVFNAQRKDFKGLAAYYIDTDDVDLQLSNDNGDDVFDENDLKLDYQLSYTREEQPATARLLINHSLLRYLHSLGVSVTLKHTPLHLTTVQMTVCGNLKSQHVECIYDPLTSDIYGITGQMNVFKTRKSASLRVSPSQPMNNYADLDHVTTCLQKIAA